MQGVPHYTKGANAGMVQQIDPNTISTFKELTRHFVTHFIGG